jgi:hypothetical protein
MMTTRAQTCKVPAAAAPTTQHPSRASPSAAPAPAWMADSGARGSSVERRTDSVGGRGRGHPCSPHQRPAPWRAPVVGIGEEGDETVGGGGLVDDEGESNFRSQPDSSLSLLLFVCDMTP